MQATPISSPVTPYVFGTSGYRDDTEAGFNAAVVAQITQSIIDYLIGIMQTEGVAKPVLIGGDTREKTRVAIPQIVRQLNAAGLDVYEVNGDVPTPVLALLARDFHKLNLPDAPKETAGAILMTASHNPWAYGGYNFLTPDAAIVPSHISSEFVALQKEPKRLTLDRHAMGLPAAPVHQMIDAYPVYQEHLKNQVGIRFDRIAEAVRTAGLKLFYDPMYATGRTVMPRLMQEEGIPMETLHNTAERPDGYTGMPEPSGEHLTELADRVRESGKQYPLTLGMANDGDADRFGILDETGRSLNPNEVLALTLHHLTTHGLTKSDQVIVRSQATSHMLDAMAEQAGYGVVQTPVGYKYIAETFIEHEAPGSGKAPVLLGGESSGGLSIGGHIPEKDGILANLLIAELVATEKKPVSQILQTLKDQLPQKYRFSELAIKTPHGKDILIHFQQLQQQGGSVGGLKIDKAQTEEAALKLEQAFGTRDGAKLYLEGGHWALVRISGTEPMVRVYSETVDSTAEGSELKTAALLGDLRSQLAEKFSVTDSDIKVKV